MIKVLVADDHKVLIDGIKSILKGEHEINVVAEASNGQEVLDHLKKLEVDVILLDINMPVLDGLDTCKLVHKNYPEIKILALTMYGEGSFISGMLKNGASGYVLKDSNKQELIDAIKTVFSGEKYYSQKVTQILISSMMPGKTISSNPLLPKITRREKEILKLIVNEFTTHEIADKLFISLSTVETHRANLLSKLNVRNTAGLVRIAIEKGLVGI